MADLDYSIILRTVGANTLGSAFRSMSSQSRELGSSIRDLNRVMGAAQNVDRLRSKLDQLNRELAEGTRPNDEVQREIAQTQAALQRAERSASRYGIDLDHLSDELRRMGRAAEQASRRLDLVNRRQELSSRRSELMGKAMATAGAVMSVAMPVKQAIEYESAVADLGKVFDGTSDQLKAYQAQALQVSESSGLAAKDVVGLYASLSQGGIAANELGAVAQTAIEMSVAFDNLDPTAAGEVMANWRNAMGLTNDQAKELAGTVNFLSDTTAASSGDMVNAMSRLGGSAKQAGLSPKETAAFAAQVLSAGVNAETASTALGKLFSTLTLGGSLSGRAQEALGNLGFDPAVLAKSMQQDAAGTVMAVMDAIGKVAPESRVSVISDIFGTDADTRRAIAPLIGNLGGLAKTLQSVSEDTSHAGSLTAEYERRQQTTAQTLRRLRASVTNLGISFGTLLLPVVARVSEIVASTTQRIRAFTERFPGASKAVAALAASLVALQFSMLAVRIGSLVASSSILAVRSAALTTSLVLPRLTAGFRALTTMRLASVFAPLLPILGALTSVMLPVVAVVAALGAGLVLLYKHFDYVAAFAKGFWRVIVEQLGPSVKGITVDLSFLSPVLDFIGSLFTKTKYSTDELSGAMDSGASFAGTLVTALRLIGDFLSPLGWLLDSIGSYIGWFAAQVVGLTESLMHATDPIDTIVDKLGNLKKTISSGFIVRQIGGLFGGDDEDEATGPGATVTSINSARARKNMPGMALPVISPMTGSNVIDFPQQGLGANQPGLSPANRSNTVTDNSRTEITVNVQGGTNGATPEAIAQAVSAEQDRRRAQSSRTRMLD